MSQDSAEDGYFLAALDSFVTRTCYANAGGEYLCSLPLMSWPLTPSCHKHQSCLLPALLKAGVGLLYVGGSCSWALYNTSQEATLTVHITVLMDVVSQSLVHVKKQPAEA